MEISKEIIAEGCRNIGDHYGKLNELFATKQVPECKQINETIESLKNTGQILYHKKYPDLKSRYPWLGNCVYTIYIFTAKNFPYAGDEIGKIFEGSKKENKILFPRINEHSPDWKNVKSNEPVCLYVGSSEHISQRLKEHLFLCNPTAHALHLEGWYPHDLPFSISLWDFTNFLHCENGDEYFQSIEDILWDHYKPLFGRHGKK